MNRRLLSTISLQGAVQGAALSLLAAATPAYAQMFETFETDMAWTTWLGIGSAVLLVAALAFRTTKSSDTSPYRKPRTLSAFETGPAS